MIFSNDDRPERPFVVCRKIEKNGRSRRCWYLLLINLYQKVIINQIELDISFDEYRDAQITPSTEIQECLLNKNGEKIRKMFYQNFKILFSKSS